MFLLAVATSIDAAAVGVSLAMEQANIWLAVALIGVVTFAMCTAGVKIGNVFGSRYKSKAEFAGGFILVAMGLKILIEHLCC
jgi:putative Mn2+ efflux pump MntP